MRRVVLLGLAILAIVLLAYYATTLPPAPEQSQGSGSPTTETPTGHTADPNTSDHKPTPPKPARPTAGIERPATATLSRVAYVHDGDTLYLQPAGTSSRNDQITVRLLGVDTPELRPEVECYAEEARDHLRGLLPVGASVWIAADRGPLDRYDRTLLYLWTEAGDSVNFDLVVNGFATAVRIPPNEAYWPQLKAAQATARDAGRGLWGSC